MRLLIPGEECQSRRDDIHFLQMSLVGSKRVHSGPLGTSPTERSEMVVSIPDVLEEQERLQQERELEKYASHNT